MTKTIATISELTSALVMNGHHRVEGDSVLLPSDGLKADECRWTYRPHKGSLVIAAGVRVIDADPMPVLIQCHLDDELEELTGLSVTIPGKGLIASMVWMRVSLDVILQLTLGITKTWLMSEVGDEPWIESQERPAKS